MPVTIQCPRCNKELAAPDELIGKVAACPRCNTQFPVTMNVRGSAPSLLTPSLAATGPISAPASASPSPPAGSGTMSVITATIPSNLPPSVATGSSTPPAPPDIRRSHPTFIAPIPAVPVSDNAVSPNAGTATAETAGSGTAPTGPAATGKSSTSSSVASIKVVAPSTSATGSRDAQPARFINAESTDTRLNLGADGRLPELMLHEGPKPDAAETAERSSHPLRLLVILGASFVALVWVLTMDTGEGGNESRFKADARQELQDLYARRNLPHHPRREYQELLGKALQAHNQGKYADEQRYYRRVLNLLRDEALQKDAANVKGLTGVRKGDGPSDEHLESLLSRLLSNH